MNDDTDEPVALANSAGAQEGSIRSEPVWLVQTPSGAFGYGRTLDRAVAEANDADEVHRATKQKLGIDDDQ